VLIATQLRAAAEAGRRRAELIGVRWPDVRLEQRRTEVRRSVWHVDGTWGETSAKGRCARKVAISDATAARFAKWYEESVNRGDGDTKRTSHVAAGTITCARSGPGRAFRSAIPSVRTGREMQRPTERRP
jgi:integrase